MINTDFLKKKDNWVRIIIEVAVCLVAVFLMWKYGGLRLRYSCLVAFGALILYEGVLFLCTRFLNVTRTSPKPEYKKPGKGKKERLEVDTEEFFRYIASGEMKVVKEIPDEYFEKTKD